MPTEPTPYAEAALGIGSVEVHVFGLCGACAKLPDWGERVSKRRHERWGGEQ